MQIFINECSLHSQYHTQEQFTSAIREFIECLDFLRGQKETQANRSENLYLMYGLNQTNLSTALRNNSDLTVKFKDSIQKNNVKSWELNRTHLAGIPYTYREDDYNGYSIAEFAERKIQDTTIMGFLLNFSNSKFGDNEQIAVLKENITPVLLDCTSNTASVYNWFVEQGKIIPETNYDEKSRLAPTDSQTVLSNTGNFERTNYPKNNGRTEYKRIGFDQLWVVDGSKRHATISAHIEVFHSITRKHLGTSLYNKIEIDENYKENDRYITLT